MKILIFKSTFLQKVISLFLNVLDFIDVSLYFPMRQRFEKAVISLFRLGQGLSCNSWVLYLPYMGSSVGIWDLMQHVRFSSPTKD